MKKVRFPEEIFNKTNDVNKKLHEIIYENVLNLEDAEEIRRPYKLAQLQKLWLLNLSNRDIIMSLKEEPYKLILVLKSQDEFEFVSNRRRIYESQQLLNSKDPNDHQHKQQILNQFIRGMNLSYGIRQFNYDQHISDNEKASHFTFYCTEELRFEATSEWKNGSLNISMGFVPNT